MTVKPTTDIKQRYVDDFVRLRRDMEVNRRRAKLIETWMKPDAHGFHVPRHASQEHRRLADLARSPWLKLVVDNVAQSLSIRDIVRDGGGHDDVLWRLWLSNSGPRMQVPNHRTVVSESVSYGVVSAALPYARIRFVPMSRLAADYIDPADPYAAVALEFIRAEGKSKVWHLHYPGKTYNVRTPENDDDSPVFHSVEETGLDVTPVVRFANQINLEGETAGEVEPYIPIAQRIQKTVYDRLLTQHFNSWRVKTATGLDLPVTEVVDAEGNVVYDGLNPRTEIDNEAGARLKQKLSQEDILISESPDTKFGTLEATDLSPFIASAEADVETLAAISQTPAHALTGQLVNLNAEALAAARQPITAKIFERQRGIGDSYSHLLRLAAARSGYTDIAEDPTVHVVWEDVEVKSLSQAADALGKIRQMLGVPAEALWDHVPGIEPIDVANWKRLRDDEAARNPLSTIPDYDNGGEF